MFIFSNHVDDVLYRMEKKFSMPVTAIITGIFLILCAMLYTSPGFEAHYHGFAFSEISSDPFNFHSNRALQYRILAPLLGYILFLRGELFFLLPIIFGVLFQGAVYFSFRKKDFSPFESLLLASFMSFSCTILIPLVSPGYTDTVSYFFYFLHLILPATLIAKSESASVPSIFCSLFLIMKVIFSSCRHCCFM